LFSTAARTRPSISFSPSAASHKNRALAHDGFPGELAARHHGGGQVGAYESFAEQVLAAN
jgi:hypothetical protein